MLKAFADELHMRFVPLKDFKIDPAALTLFPATAVFRHGVLPLERVNGHVTVATSDPFDFEALDELGSLANVRLDPVLSCKDEIMELIKQSLGVGGDTITQLVAQQQEEGVEFLDEIPPELGELAESAQAPSVIRLVNELLVEALDQRASDIHIEPQEKGLTVRYRVDGLLRVQPVPPEINQFASSIVTRLKIMSRLNIAEKRLPQDGRINLRVQGREIDVRMSIIPMIHGEGVVLRLLDKQRMVFNLQSVGMDPDNAERFRKLIELPHGIVLCTGPTGSGKTTTLYSALNEINTRIPRSSLSKIRRIPHERDQPDPGAFQNRPDVRGRSAIHPPSRPGRRAHRRNPRRRDRNGRDSGISDRSPGVQHAAHERCSSSFTRLVDMGVEPYLVASTVEGILAQRLIRLLCKHCKKETGVDNDYLPTDFPTKLEKMFVPIGCRNCRESGYAGRSGVHELLVSDPEVRRLCARMPVLA